jgi:hypothetical protein
LGAPALSWVADRLDRIAKGLAGSSPGLENSQRRSRHRALAESATSGEFAAAHRPPALQTSPFATKRESERGTNLAHAPWTELGQAAADALLRDGHDIVKIGGAGLPHAVFDSKGDFGRDASDR